MGGGWHRSIGKEQELEKRIIKIVIVFVKNKFIKMVMMMMMMALALVVGPPTRTTLQEFV